MDFILWVIIITFWIGTSKFVRALQREAKENLSNVCLVSLQFATQLQHLQPLKFIFVLLLIL
jgi:hypothetical protein